MQEAARTAQDVEGMEETDPQELGKEEDYVEQQIQEAERTAQEVEQDVEDDDSQELSGSPEVRAERSVDKAGGGATRCRDSENNADQATDERARVRNGLRVGSGILLDGADQIFKGNTVDLVESRPEPMKPLEGLQTDADWKAEG